MGGRPRGPQGWLILTPTSNKARGSWAALADPPQPAVPMPFFLPMPSARVPCSCPSILSVPPGDTCGQQRGAGRAAHCPLDRVVGTASLWHPAPAQLLSCATPVPGTRDGILRGWSKGVSGDSNMPWCGSSGVWWHSHRRKPVLPSGRVAACSPALAAMHSTGSCWDLPECLQM